MHMPAYDETISDDEVAAIQQRLHEMDAVEPGSGRRLWHEGIDYDQIIPVVSATTSRWRWLRAGSVVFSDGNEYWCVTEWGIADALCREMEQERDRPASQTRQDDPLAMA